MLLRNQFGPPIWVVQPERADWTDGEASSEVKSLIDCHSGRSDGHVWVRCFEAWLCVDLSGYINLAITAASLPIKSPHIQPSALFSKIQYPTNPQQISIYTYNPRSLTWKTPEQKLQMLSDQSRNRRIRKPY
ncbi:hypothetical protein PGTUg99_030896 [Puccinia graminis f. sp. tritici]|uniref:Uncharacterized protein n=1 Tax=Puccinia graminis f. sp. tritici TaxID=56615 RepID=A0A5B0S6U6_PUCGR|nr:hypothetical protein PGTUg99_030896 [Puccinia graminis f. sp. tritici]